MLAADAIWLNFPSSLSFNNPFSETTRGWTQVLISSIKGEVKKKHFSAGWNFSCFSAHWMEQDLF
jgi:hypothetical protein